MLRSLSTKKKKKNTNGFLKLEKKWRSYEHSYNTVYSTWKINNKESVVHYCQVTPLLSGSEEREKNLFLPQTLRWRIKLPWHIHYIWPHPHFLVLTGLHFLEAQTYTGLCPNKPKLRQRRKPTVFGTDYKKDQMRSKTIAAVEHLLVLPKSTPHCLVEGLGDSNSADCLISLTHY